MTLQHPGLLWLALLLPAALLVRWRRRPAGVRFAPGLFLPGLPRSWRVRLLFLPHAIEAAALLLAVVALARPIERIPLPHETEGIDIMLCLDTSSSMLVNDMDGDRTRLDVAKAAATRFVAGRKDDRIGLISFARFPDLRCPPTRDHNALAAFLKELQLVQSDGPEDATGIGTAVARAAQVLGGGAQSKVIILLTDGEENVATARQPDEIAPVHAGQLCRRLGVRVYAIAAGLGRRNRAGEWVELDTDQIRRVAAGTGGRFFEARDAGAVAGVYGEIDRLEKSIFAEPRYEVRERFVPFLAAALALWIVGLFLRSTVWAVLP